MRQRSAARVALLLLLTAETVMAAPSFEVSVQGTCPSQVDLIRALEAKGKRTVKPGDPADYTVTARSESTGALLQLARSHGERLLERRLSSDDCRALAEAMAVVVEAYFVEVGALQPLPAKADPAAPASTANEPLPSASAADTLPLAPIPSVTSNAAHLLPSAGAPTAPPPKNRPTSGPRAPWVASVVARPRRFLVIPRPTRTLLPRAIVGLGPSLALPQGDASLAFEAGGGVDLPSLPLFADFAAATSLPVTVGSSPNRVWRWVNQALLRVGMPLGNELGYRPWAGIGAAVTRLRANDLPIHPTRTTVAPILAVGFEVTWPMGRIWHARMNLGCSGYPISDRYRVDTTQEIGNGPRIVCTSALGVGWGGIPVEK